MKTHPFNPSSQEAGAEGSQIQSQLVLHNMTLSPKKGKEYWPLKTLLFVYY
jgi:hypothetical protein